MTATPESRLEARLRSACYYRRFWANHQGKTAAQQHSRYTRLVRQLQQELEAQKAVAV